MSCSQLSAVNLRMESWNYMKAHTGDNIKTTQEWSWGTAQGQKFLSCPLPTVPLHELARTPGMLRRALRQESIFQVASTWIKPLSFISAPASQVMTFKDAGSWTWFGEPDRTMWPLVRPCWSELGSQLLVAGWPCGRDCRNFPAAAETSLSWGLSLLSLWRHQLPFNTLLVKGSRE